MHNKEGSNASF